MTRIAIHVRDILPEELIKKPERGELQEFKQYLHNSGLAMTSCETYACSVLAALRDYNRRDLPKGYASPLRAWLRFKRRDLAGDPMLDYRLSHSCVVCQTKSELTMIRVCKTHALELLARTYTKAVVKEEPVVVEIKRKRAGIEETHSMLLDYTDYENLKHCNFVVLARAPEAPGVNHGNKRESVAHMLIGKPAAGQCVYPLNGDWFDLRRENLRIGTSAEAQLNRRILDGKAAVARHHRKFVALTRIGSKALYGPSRETREEAERDYKRLLIERGAGDLFSGKTTLKDEATDGVIFQGEHYESLAEIIRRHGKAEESLVRSRISKGWSIERAVLTPSGPIGRPRFLSGQD